MIKSGVEPSVFSKLFDDASSPGENCTAFCNLFSPEIESQQIHQIHLNQELDIAQMPEGNIDLFKAPQQVAQPQPPLSRGHLDIPLTNFSSNMEPKQIYQYDQQAEWQIISKIGGELPHISGSVVHTPSIGEPRTTPPIPFPLKIGPQQIHQQCEQVSPYYGYGEGYKSGRNFGILSTSKQEAYIPVLGTHPIIFSVPYLQKTETQHVQVQNWLAVTRQSPILVLPEAPEEQFGKFLMQIPDGNLYNTNWLGRTLVIAAANCASLSVSPWTFTQKFGPGRIVKFDHLKDLSHAYLKEVHSGKTIYTQT
jgi:hypothetical protein